MRITRLRQSFVAFSCLVAIDFTFTMNFIDLYVYNSDINFVSFMQIRACHRHLQISLYFSRV